MLSNWIEIKQKRKRKINIDYIPIDLNGYTWLFTFNLNKYKLYSEILPRVHSSHLMCSVATCAQLDSTDRTFPALEKVLLHSTALENLWMAFAPIILKALAAHIFCLISKFLILTLVAVGKDLSCEGSLAWTWRSRESKREHKWRASKGGAEFIKPSSLNLIQEAMRRHLRRMQWSKIYFRKINLKAIWRIDRF